MRKIIIVSNKTNRVYAEKLAGNLSKNYLTNYYTAECWLEDDTKIIVICFRFAITLSLLVQQK